MNDNGNEQGARVPGTTTLPSPLVNALANAIRAAVQNTAHVVRCALGAGEAVLVSCDCSADVEDDRCVCSLALALPVRWTRAARRRLESGGSVGRVPRMRCRLCRSGDHDLVATTVVRMVIGGGSSTASIRVPQPHRISRKANFARAQRAGALPSEARVAQREAAGRV